MDEREKTELQIDTRTRKELRRAKRAADMADAVVVREKKAELKRLKKLEKDARIENQLKKIAAKQRPEAEWTHFDNAALIFPASENADMLNMYRLSVLLKDDVQPLELQLALNDCVLRFPTMTSSVKKGFFWFYLEPSDKPLVLLPQEAYPCRKITVDSRHALIRVTYFHREVSVEFFHVATDANGGFVFMNTLIARYLELIGHSVVDETNRLNVMDKPQVEEMIDYFQKFSDGITPRQERDIAAYNIPGKKLPSYALVLTKGIMSASQLNSVARGYGLTVGQLGTACLIWAIEQDRIANLHKRKLPIVVSVPANLRKICPTKTLRNFMSMAPIASDVSGDINALFAEVKEQFETKNVDAYYKGLVNYNIKIQHNPLIQIVPLPLKMIVMRIGLHFKSDKVITSLFSNLGRVGAPKEFDNFVERFEFSFGPQSCTGTALSAVTFNDVAVFTFSRSVRETNIEKIFFRTLSEMGVEVCVECNDEYVR